MNGETRRISLSDGREIQYHLEQKPVKNLNLRICKDGTVHVSANSCLSITSLAAPTIRKVSSITTIPKTDMALIWQTLWRCALTLNLR